jgi:1-acyl-sn-glycerol-3-phosphate acyltransferase
MTSTLARTAARPDSPVVEIPRRWPWLFQAFRRYSHKYAARHLHAVRVSRAGLPPQSWTGPAVVVLNHPSWWDPILAFILSNLWPDRLDYAPMDAAALKKYGFLSKVGLFGVETGSIAGAEQFLRTARAILAHDHASLWITAQGQFTDVRERPTKLRSGVGHLAAGMDRGVVLPVALEYPFWDERTPEGLVCFGEPLDVARHQRRSARQWTAHIETALQAAQDQLAADAVSRDPARFIDLVKGKAGVGGMYDFGRRLKAWARGRRFRPDHADSPFDG